MASAVVVFLRFQSSTLSRLFPAPSAALTSVAASKSHPKSQPSRSTSSALSLRHYKSSDTRLLLIYQSNQHPQYRRCRHDHPSPPSHAASPTHRTASPSRLRSLVTRKASPAYDPTLGRESAPEDGEADDAGGGRREGVLHDRAAPARGSPPSARRVVRWRVRTRLRLCAPPRS